MRISPALAPIASLLLLAACSNQPNADNGAPANPADMPEPALTALANARTAIDWTGTYLAMTPEGGRSVLTLMADNSYVWSATAPGSQPANVRGKARWDASGGRLTLDAAADNASFAVGDGVVFRLATPDAPASGAMARESALFRMNVGKQRMMPAS